MDRLPSCSPDTEYKANTSTIQLSLIRRGVWSQYYRVNADEIKYRLQKSAHGQSYQSNLQSILYHICQPKWAISCQVWRRHRSFLSIIISPIYLNTIMRKGNVKSSLVFVCSKHLSAWLWRNQLQIASMLESIASFLPPISDLVDSHDTDSDN